MGVTAETTYPAIIGRIIAQRRKDRGMDQGAAAEKAGINRSSWSRIENGDSIPDAIQLTQIAKALRWDPAQIMIEADRAKKMLEKEGITVHTTSAKSKKSSGGMLALVGAAALGALVVAAKANSDKDKS